MRPFHLTVLLFVSVLLSGCVGISGERVAADGSCLKIRADRFLWVSQNMEFTTEAEGVKVSLKAQKSSSDTQAVEALANIAVQAVNKAPAQ